MKIAVLGLGHVGLPTALGLAELGWPVVGADDDQAKARRIAQGEAPFYEPGMAELLQRQLGSGRFQVAGSVPDAVQQGTILFVCVGTPLGADGRVDLSQVESVARTIARNLNGYKLIVEKSTTPVRTAEQFHRTIARYSNGQHPFDVAVNPEFLREGTALQDFFHPDRVVLGVATPEARQMLLQIYQPLLERMAASGNGSAASKGSSPLMVTDLNTAELIKHSANAFLALKISFINLIADFCEATGADVTEVARGIGMDPRIGPAFLRAGAGYGGYCLPKDLKAFVRIAEEHGVDFSLLNEVGRINDARAERIVQRLRHATWVIKGKTVAVWGLAFKPHTDDVRDAPSLRIVSRLREEGASLRLHDPWAMEQFRRDFPDQPPRLVYCPSPENAAEGADALVILTEWPEYLKADLARLRESMAAPIIVDGRNLMDPAAVRALGFDYYGIGRP
ncbi:MAG: UDP-glucose/GDP-mannose dehydrogenase family protein [SAR202 cluster bacterium]|nr:UDP-glucose/GDP-mannose dehydrogenase family protein [SAR202 cluster bacterium]